MSRSIWPCVTLLLLLPASVSSQGLDLTGDEPELGPSDAGPEVRVLDPADNSFEAGARAEGIFTEETIVFRTHRERVKRMAGTQDDKVGGNAMVGIVLGDRGMAMNRAKNDGYLKARFEDWDGYGAAVLSVVPGSPADAARLVEGDIIVKFAELWVDEPDTMIRMASRAEPGREYETWYLADGQVFKTWLVPRSREEVGGFEGSEVERAYYPQGTPGLRMPTLVEEVVPEYPAKAVEAGVSAVIKLNVVVDAEGQVAGAAIRQGTGRFGFNDLALEAVKARVYEPGEMRGQPVGVSMMVTVEFRADPSVDLSGQKKRRSRKR